MDAIEKLRAKGMHDVASEFMRNRNELIVARRALLVSHQINEEYRGKLEAFQAGEANPDDSASEQSLPSLLERCAALTQALDAANTQGGEIQDRLAQSNRSLALAIKTAQEEGAAREEAERKAAQYLAQIQALEEKIESERGQHAETQTSEDQNFRQGGLDDGAIKALIETLESRVEVQRQEIVALEALRSENDALRRQLETCIAQNTAIAGADQHAQAQREKDVAHIACLEEEKNGLAQQVRLSSQAMRTLQEDIETAQSALKVEQAEKVALMARNAALSEQVQKLVRDAATRHAAIDTSSKAGSASADAPEGMSDDSDSAASACARTDALSRILDETIFRNRLPDAEQTQEIRAQLDDRTGRLALCRLMEIEKGRMTRRILAALSTEESASGQ